MSFQRIKDFTWNILDFYMKMPILKKRGKVKSLLCITVIIPCSPKTDQLLEVSQAVFVGGGVSGLGDRGKVASIAETLEYTM